MLLNTVGLKWRGGVNPSLYLKSVGGRFWLLFAANCSTKRDQCRPLSILLSQLAGDV